MAVILGQINEGEKLEIDVQKLSESRLLIQANSGGGKSWAIRKLLEETHGKIQHIVLDIEGEFTTLREKFDYIVCGKEGDIPVSIKTAELLARKLLELNASAIIDLYELKQHERILFVKRFLESMVDAPKDLWHPCLVIIDEAHQFCPENGKAESASGVIDLATRGRKRGYCACLATQRLSKLNKDAAAECNNKLIGRTGLDVDMKRAGEELGFASKENMRSLRDLEPGEFYAFGPALSKQVVKAKIGGVITSHPKLGARVVSLVPAKGKVLEALKKLKELPHEAEKQLKEKSDLESEIRSLRGQLSASKVIREKAVITKVLDNEAIKKAFQEGYNLCRAEANVQLKNAEVIQKQFENKLNQLKVVLDKKIVINSINFVVPAKEIQKELIKFEVPKSTLKYSDKIELVYTSITEGTKEINSELPAGSTKILKVLSQFDPEKLSKKQISILVGYSVKSSSFINYLSAARTKGFLKNNGDSFEITTQGKELIGEVELVSTNSDELFNMWLGKFNSGPQKILKVLYENHPEPMLKEDVAAGSGFSPLSSSFINYLSELRSTGLIQTDKTSVCLDKWLFLEK